MYQINAAELDVITAREVHEAIHDVQQDLVSAMLVVTKANVLNQHDHLLTSMARSFAQLEQMFKTPIEGTYSADQMYNIYADGEEGE